MDDDPRTDGDLLNPLLQGDGDGDFWDSIYAFNEDFGSVNHSMRFWDDISTGQCDRQQSNSVPPTNPQCLDDDLNWHDMEEVKSLGADYAIDFRYDDDEFDRFAQELASVSSKEFLDMDFASHSPLSKVCIQAALGNSTNSGLESPLLSTTPPPLKRKRGNSESVHEEIGKSGRSVISLQDRVTLEEYFLQNPYPSKGDLVSLSRVTSLTWMSIRIWFSNARSRKYTTHNLRDTYPGNSALEDQGQSMVTPASPSELSTAALDDLNSSTHAPCLDSLGRYLTSSLSDEPVAAAVLEASAQANSGTEPRTETMLDSHDVLTAAGTREKSPTKISKWEREWERDTQRILRAAKDQINSYRSSGLPGLGLKSQSRQESDSSAGSVQSFSSQFSVDSRGSRRGRKLLRCSSSNPGAPKHGLLNPVPPKPGLLFPATPVNTTHPVAPSKLSLFCTWLGCTKRFRYRYEWSRHEEAIHHCPYHWICCLNTSTVMRLPHCFVCDEKDVLLSHVTDCHFEDCAHRSQEERTFVRVDQLTQHIKGVHLSTRGMTQSKKLSIPKDLLAFWKLDNPSLKKASLHCGFCGIILPTWAQRQDHVYAHLQRGMCEAAWCPDRLPTFDISSHISSDPMNFSPISADNAGLILGSQIHSTSVTWSCRYLLDFHAAFSSSDLLTKSSFINCKLCTFSTVLFDGKSSAQACKKHADQHTLRGCDQAVFKSRESFIGHLFQEHRAEFRHVRCDSDAWRRIQHFEKAAGQELVHTLLPIGEVWPCNAKQPGFFCTSTS